MDFSLLRGFLVCRKDAAYSHHTEGVKGLAVLTAPSFGRVSTHALSVHRAFYEDTHWQKWPYHTCFHRTAPVSIAPVSTAPVSTAPVSTAPVSTAPVSTAPVSTAPVSTTSFT
jgi:hypothetical protein